MAKRRPKNPIKFNVQLNDEQKKAKELILNNPITVLKGMAGSGKTMVATQVALDLLFTKKIDKIVITRPTVSKEDIGFLPGDLQAKMDPWLAPIYHNLFMLYNEEKVRKEMENGRIEIVPFAFMRGRTFLKSFVIVDEAQNVTHSQMETVIGRLGRGSKMAICGDIAQIDLRDKRETGFSFLARLEEQVQGFVTCSLEYNHRHEIVAPILDVYKTFRD
jgi:phosphate starvation-inducible protein PhoH and related proteins